MKNTTLCYIEKDNNYLMLLRNKKEIDENKGKWIGVGGKFEEGESPEDCLLREVKEETGLTLTSYRLRGIVTFVSDEWGSEYMYLFTADRFTDDTSTEEKSTDNTSADDCSSTDAKNHPGYETLPCDEGELRWIPKDKIMDLNLWEGDRIFLDLLINPPSTGSSFFTLKLVYKGEELVNSEIRNY